MTGESLALLLSFAARIYRIGSAARAWMLAGPAHAWTLDELAKLVAQSRSVLAQRFADIVGIPPIRYLSKWRMQIAAERLKGGTTSLSDIAVEVGYGSDSAFSRAFKKMTGVAPSAWRRGSTQSG